MPDIPEGLIPKKDLPEGLVLREKPSLRKKLPFQKQVAGFLEGLEKGKTGEKVMETFKNLARDLPGFLPSLPAMALSVSPAGMAISPLAKVTEPIREKVEGLPVFAPLKRLEEKVFDPEKGLFPWEIMPTPPTEQVKEIAKRVAGGEPISEIALDVAKATPGVGFIPRLIEDPESFIERPFPTLMDLAILFGGVRAIPKRGAKVSKVPPERLAQIEKIGEPTIPERLTGIEKMEIPPVERPFGLIKKEKIAEGKKKIFGKEELALKRELQKRGVTEKPAEIPAELEGVVAIPKGWKVEVQPNWRRRPGWKSEVDWQGKRIVFESATDAKNPAMMNHEIAHVRIERLLTDTARKSLLDEYAKVEQLSDWVIKNKFHHEKIAMDYGTYLTDPTKVSPKVSAVFDKYFPKQAAQKPKPAAKAVKEPSVKYEASIGRSRSYVLDIEKQEIVQGSTFRGAGHAKKAKGFAERLNRPAVKEPVVKVKKTLEELEPSVIERVPETELKVQAKEMLGETEFISLPAVTKGRGRRGVSVAYDPATTPEWYTRVGLDKRQTISGLKAITKEGYKTENPYARSLLGAIEDQATIKRGEVPMYAGLPVPEAIKEVTRLTNELIQKAKAPPEVRAGVIEAQKAMIEHDRQIRNTEFTSRLFEKTINDVVPDKNRQMLMVHAYEQKMKGKYWDQLTDLEQSMVEWIGKEKKKLNKFIEENQVLEMMPESKEINHIFHHWINPETGQPYKAMYGKFSKGLPQAKQRIIPTYEAGIEKGLTPATTNIGKLVGSEWESVTRAYQARSMFKTLHNISAEKGVEIQLMKGKPAKPVRMVERWDLLAKQGLTEDYIRYSHPALDKAITFKTPDGTLVRLKGAVGIRKELFPFVRAYLENPNYGTFSKLNFATKSLKLGLSLFHPIQLGMQELANWRIPFKNIPRGLRERKNLSPDLRMLYQEGLDLFKGYEDVGYRNKFFEGERWWSKAGNTVTKPIEAMRSLIFDVVQPGMKVSFALDKYRQLLPEYLKKGLTKEQCARDAVKAADGHFSHEHWKRSLLETNRFMVKAYFMPEARRAWQTALLSPTWQREHLLVAKNVAKSFMPDRFIKKLGLEEMGPIKAEYRKYALGAIMIISTADLYNLFATQKMDGKARHLWQNPEGKGFAVRAPWNEPGYTITTADGKEKRVKGGPAYFRPLKSVFEVAEWVSTPLKKFVWKLSPVVSAMGQQAWPSKYQKEYKGWPDMPRRARDFLLDVGTPISASQWGRVLMGKKTPQAAALPFFGFPTSKLDKKKTERLYYQRLARIERQSGYNEKWKRVRKEFEIMGFTFNHKKYQAYKQEPTEKLSLLPFGVKIP